MRPTRNATLSFLPQAKSVSLMSKYTRPKMREGSEGARSASRADGSGPIAPKSPTAAQTAKDGV